MSIKELDEYCLLNAKKIIARHGKMTGISPLDYQSYRE